MATVRISGNWRNPNVKEWAGAPAISPEGRIERSIKLPEEVYVALERAIAKGDTEGTLYLTKETRVDWFLDK